MTIKNIIFDLSGVLIDDVYAVYVSYMYVFRKNNIKKITLGEFKDQFVLPYYLFVKKYIKNKDIIELKKQFYDFYNKQNFRPKAFKEAKPALEFLKKKKIKMIVLSAKKEFFVKKELQQLSLKKYFTAIYGTVKDKSAVIKDLLKKHNFNPKETAYVGDMTHDIDAGKAGKVTTIAVLTGYQSKEKLEKSNPDFIIKDLTELKKLIQCPS